MVAGECKPVPARSLVFGGAARSDGNRDRCEQFVVDRPARPRSTDRVATADRRRLRRRAGDVQRDGRAAARGASSGRDDDDVVAAVRRGRRPRPADRRPRRRPQRRRPRVADGALVVDLRDGCDGRRSIPTTPDRPRRRRRAVGGRRRARPWRIGLAVVGGTFGDTGVGGLTLSGGIGWLMGIAGFTCDNLVRGRGRDRRRERSSAGPGRRPGAALGAARRRRQLRRRHRASSSGLIDPGPILGRLHRATRSAPSSRSCGSWPSDRRDGARRARADRRRSARTTEALAEAVGPRRRSAGRAIVAEPDARSRRCGAPAGDRPTTSAPMDVPRRPGDERPAAVRPAPLLEGPLPARRSTSRSSAAIVESMAARPAGDSVHPARGDQRAARVEPAGGAAFGQRAARWNASAARRSGRTRDDDERTSPGRARRPIARGRRR